MDVETLKLKVQYCVQRAQDAERDDVRDHWVAAAYSWQLAIETRLRLQQLRAEQDGPMRWPFEGAAP
jgi:hypothetical protein